ncbi:hypothetical protein B5X24_HaOG211590 [Helicoverpa armigera]|nr:hypothetical protein B5X24_HaOG211590 [Helicoverpa armigera]
MNNSYIAREMSALVKKYATIVVTQRRRRATGVTCATGIAATRTENVSRGRHGPARLEPARARQQPSRGLPPPLPEQQGWHDLGTPRPAKAPNE